MPGTKAMILGTNPSSEGGFQRKAIPPGPTSARYCQRQPVGVDVSAKSLSYWGAGDLTSVVRDECQARDIDVLVFDEDHFKTFVERLSGDVHWVAQHIGAGTFTDMKMIADIAKKIGATKYYIKEHKGQRYLIFKGKAGLREVLRGTRYRDMVGNKKLLRLALGKAGLTQNGLKSGVWSVALLTATNIIEFVIHEELAWAELGGNVAVDLGISVVATAAGTMFAATWVAKGAVVVAVAPIAVGIAVSLGVGYVLGKAVDKLQLREALQKFFQQIQENMETTKRNTNRWLHFLNTPEGLWWFQQRLLGR